MDVSTVNNDVIQAIDLRDAFVKYIRNRNASRSAAVADMVVMLRRAGLPLHAHALEMSDQGHAYVQMDLGSQYPHWGQRRCWVRDYPDRPADSGDLWFDPVELSFNVFIGRYENWGGGLEWMSMGPVSCWKYDAFLQLVKWEGGHVRPPKQFLQPRWVRPYDVRSTASGVYFDEAQVYCGFFGLGLSSASEMNAFGFQEGTSRWEACFPKDRWFWQCEEISDGWYGAVNPSLLGFHPPGSGRTVHYVVDDVRSPAAIYGEFDPCPNVAFTTSTTYWERAEPIWTDSWVEEERRQSNAIRSIDEVAIRLNSCSAP